VCAVLLAEFVDSSSAAIVCAHSVFVLLLCVSILCACSVHACVLIAQQCCSCE
jgi:hypothetical protein